MGHGQRCGVQGDDVAEGPGGAGGGVGGGYGWWKVMVTILGLGLHICDVILDFWWCSLAKMARPGHGGVLGGWLIRNQGCGGRPRSG